MKFRFQQTHLEISSGMGDKNIIFIFIKQKKKVITLLFRNDLGTQQRMPFKSLPSPRGS